MILYNPIFTIAVIGGGFTGLMVAAQLIRQSKAPLELHLWEHRHAVGEGVAYSTTDPYHLLNVPAGRMGAWADNPGHFYQWLVDYESVWRQLHPSYTTLELTQEAFIPRMLYGYYLQMLWRESIALAQLKGINLQLHRAEVTQLRPATDNAQAVEIFDDVSSTSWRADAVVLALGVPPPKWIEGLDSTVQMKARYVANPWHTASSLPELIVKITAHPTCHVVLLGSGLTTVDIAISLLERQFSGQLTILSRSGQLPQPHLSYSQKQASCFDNAPLPERSYELFRRWRKSLATAGDWRAAIDALRPQTNALWQHLPLAEQRIFLRHLASLWSHHRHRAPQSTRQYLLAKQQIGQVRLVQGSIKSIISDGTDELSINYQTKLPPHSTSQLKASFIINCLGWELDVKHHPAPLLQDLLAKQWIVPGPLNRGLQVTTGCRLAGQAPCPLYAGGVLLSGVYFESVAVPELRQQCAAIAESLLAIYKNREISHVYKDSHH